jgi:hypothetical protein
LYLTPKEFDTCDCGAKQVCGIAFRWDASSNDAKHISILGNGRTRIDFQSQYDCGDAPGPLYYQTKSGNDIAYEVDFVDQDGNSDENGNSQSFEVRSLFYFPTCTVLLFLEHACPLYIEDLTFGLYNILSSTMLMHHLLISENVTGVTAARYLPCSSSIPRTVHWFLTSRR